MRAFGAPEKAIAAKAKEWAVLYPEPESIEVFPENAAAFHVFWALRAQWEMPGPQGGRCTVAFTDLDVAIRRLGVRRPRDCFARVALMIVAARSVLIDKHNRAIATASTRTG